MGRCYSASDICHCERSEAIHLTAVPVVRWIASSQGLLAMTWIHFGFNLKHQIHVCLLAAGDARGLRFIVPRNKEGAGNAGCALHPRSRVQRVERKRTRAYRFSGGDPTFPAQWLYDLYRALPGVSGFLASVAFRKLALWPGWAFAPPKDLTPTTEASEPHDFAVRLSTARLHVL
jgi:hypothetical protein